MGYKVIFVIAIAMTCEMTMWTVLCKCYAPIFSEIAFAITVCERALKDGHTELKFYCSHNSLTVFWCIVVYSYHFVDNNHHCFPQ